MQKIYKGYELNVNKEKCLAGYDLIYYSIYRVEDGLELVCNFRDGGTCKEVMKELKDIIDDPELVQELEEGYEYEFSS